MAETLIYPEGGLLIGWVAPKVKEMLSQLGKVESLGWQRLLTSAGVREQLETLDWTSSVRFTSRKKQEGNSSLPRLIWSQKCLMKHVLSNLTSGKYSFIYIHIHISCCSSLL